MPESAQSVFLTFGDQKAELPMEDFGLQALEQIAEAQFGLVPKSYGFYDSHGKLDSAAALRRALQMSVVCGACVIEVKERQEWVRIREMEEKIRALTDQANQEPARVAEAMSVVESRVLAAVNAALVEVWAGMKRTDEQVCCSMAPLVKNLAISQIQLRKEFEAVDDRLQKAHSVIAPLLESLAVEQIDTRCKLQHVAKLEGLSVESLAAKVDSISADVECCQENDSNVNAKIKSIQAEVRHAISEMDSKFRREMLRTRDGETLADASLKALEADVRRLQEVMPTEPNKIEVAGWTVPTTSALREDASGRGGLGSSRTSAACRTSSGHFPGYAYSMKAAETKDVAHSGLANVTAPFVRSCSNTPLRFSRERIPGCRSSPQLPPVS
eukprot:TRINITY_DN61949_c0_g1_i1.p1 TRINITY_DN61949_c0_g1~~TRINITY_DN61949_c0_g1_i1.p1  ORF type:complete len:385 (-),score=59.91 TRINITY_DN61949_c0_g1_i1:126-1280(-)